MKGFFSCFSLCFNNFSIIQPKENKTRESRNTRFSCFSESFPLFGKASKVLLSTHKIISIQVKQHYPFNYCSNKTKLSITELEVKCDVTQLCSLQLGGGRQEHQEFSISLNGTARFPGQPGPHELQTQRITSFELKDKLRVHCACPQEH